MTEKESGVAVEVRSQQVPALIRLTDQDIAIIGENIKQAEKLTMSVLEREIDYGQLPGTPAPGLFDPGASKIINGFNCYPDYRVLYRVEEDSVISYVIQSVLISRQNQMVVGTGIGSASTKETKYKYRWVTDPQNYGQTPEQIKALKTRTKGGRDGTRLEYRINNPEYGELANTIVKMAAKRADVDAAQSLPGVNSALRKMFTGKGQKPQQQDSPAWNRYYAGLAALGLTREQAHQMHGVKSMYDWLNSGKSLDDSLEILAKMVTDGEAGGAPLETPPATPPQAVPYRDPESLKSINDLYKACNEDFGMQPAEVVKELGYTAQADISMSPSECYVQIKANKTN